jgi:hypothetical protein
MQASPGLFALATETRIMSKPCGPIRVGGKRFVFDGEDDACQLLLEYSSSAPSCCQGGTQDLASSSIPKEKEGMEKPDRCQAGLDSEHVATRYKRLSPANGALPSYANTHRVMGNVFTLCARQWRNYTIKCRIISTLIGAASPSPQHARRFLYHLGGSY